MRVFVAGATGVIGRRVVPALVDKGHQVTGMARSPEKRTLLERCGAKPVQLDLFDRAAVRAAVAGHDVVVNLATRMVQASRAFLPGAWDENDRLRRVAAGNLVDGAMAAGASRFVQESFALTYPDSDGEWVDESVPITPARYHLSVVDSEAACARFTAGGGSGVVLRFAAFYGPDAVQLRDMVRLVQRGLSPIPGRADAFWSSVSHEDAARAVLAALKIPPGVYNVVDDEPVQREVYFASLAEALGVPPPRLLPAWTAYLFGSIGEMLARSLRLTNRKLKQAAGWEPLYRSVREGWPWAVARYTGGRRAA
jgi:nucleoside-diphosphate-sugar epimerase